MEFENAYPLTAYQELEPLCEKGHVVLVRNTVDGQLYVRKSVLSYAPALYRQLREKPAAGTPVIYGIYEDPAPVPAGATGLILIEEYLPGHTLTEHIRDDGLFSEEQCMDIGMALCRILMELHSRRPAIIHRDIKPSNVILLPDGSIRLIDFSASKAGSSREGRDTVLIGTAGFAAPEQYGFAASTPQTDLYALGVLLNILSTGTMPWEKLPEGKLRGIVSRCLEMEPKRRFANALELHDSLKNAKRQRVPWLPPGFRTLRWYKMIPAAMWYIAAFMLAINVDLDPGDSFIAWLCTCMTILLLGWLPMFFYGNYLGVWRFYPPLRSCSRWVRLAGLLIAPVFLVLMTIAVCMIPLIFVVLSELFI